MRTSYATSWLLALAVVLLGVVVLGGRDARAADPPITEPEFLKSLASVRSACKRGSCKSGTKRLERALDLHAKKPYVLARRVEIQTLARRLAFGVAYPPPKPKDLVSGKLIRYRPTSGSIRIVYTPQTMQDWRNNIRITIH